MNIWNGSSCYIYCFLFILSKVLSLLLSLLLYFYFLQKVEPVVGYEIPRGGWRREFWQGCSLRLIPVCQADLSLSVNCREHKGTCSFCVVEWWTVSSGSQARLVSPSLSVFLEFASPLTFRLTRNLPHRGTEFQHSLWVFGQSIQWNSAEFKKKPTDFLSQVFRFIWKTKTGL